MEYEIAIKGVKFYARHGVWEQEKKVGNEFIVDLSIRIPYNEQFFSDDLNNTISYADIFSIVEEEMAKPRKLLETVAATIRERIISRWKNILGGSIKICKSIPPISRMTGRSQVTLFF